MGRLANALRQLGGYMGPWSSGDPALARIFGGPPVASGVTVTEDLAMNYSAVWAAVNIIAGSIASLPLFFYRRLPNGGKERYVDHPTYRLLHDQPNPEGGSMRFRETLQAYALTWGNGYAEIQRDVSGRPVALAPIAPNRVQPYRTERGNELRYRVDGKDALGAADMLHLAGLGWDGICGYSVIRRARESIGLGLATEKFGAAFFGNGAWPGLVSMHPQKLSDAAHKRLKDSMQEAIGGPSRAHNILILEEGQKIEKVSIPPDDAQFLETRKFQTIEIARWFNLPPHKLRDLERATFSNIEQQNIEFVADTLRPWLVRWEEELNRKLIRPLERKSQFSQHLVEGLLRGDTSSRYAAYAVGRQWGWLSANDVRILENMNPVDGGDVYLIPTNMVPADRVDEVIDAQVRPPAPPAPPPAPEEGGDDAADSQARIEKLVADLKSEFAARAPEIAEVPEFTAAVAGLRDEIKALSAAPPPTPDADDLGRRAALITAERMILADVSRRMLAREKDKLRAAAKTPERLRAWIGEFYPRHAEVFGSALRPVMQMHCALTASTDDVGTMATHFVALHIDESRRDLHALLDSQPADLSAAVEAMLARWDIERVNAIPDRVMLEEITHHG